MSRLVIALCALVAVAAAAPADQTPIPIVRQSFDGPYPDGVYNYSYETGNGIKAQEEGHLQRIADNQDAIQVKGSYSYGAPDGTPIQVSYVANENGFQPQGAHLPTTPPIPPLILKALEYIAAHPEQTTPKQ